jgi:heptaprenyl diphosphate synthase
MLSHDDEPASVPSGDNTATPALAFPLPDEALAARLTQRMVRVEEALTQAAANTDRLAHAASRHLMAAGGKRLRPFLTLLTGELAGPEAGARPELITAAVAVELTHLASLYHDDVMDSALLRRGTPAAHTVWGNNVAIITGDMLFARASSLVSILGPEAVRIQAETFERLCMGQLHELTGPDTGDDPIAHYLNVLSDKTASLVATSARYGAMFGGSPRENIEALATYGEKVGVAFQLADDVLDLASTSRQSGKTPGTDLREHVPTMPVLLLRARIAAGQGTADDSQLLSMLDGDLTDDAVLEVAVTRLRDNTVVDETRALATQWATAAADELTPLPDGAVKDSLVTFAGLLANRAA